MRASQVPHPSDPAYEDAPIEAPPPESADLGPAPIEEREVRVSGAAPAGTHEEHDAHHIDREDPLMDAFFRHPDKPVIDVWEETHPPRAMSRGSRRAMYASIGIFAVSMVGIVGYTAYHTLIMPAPVELGASSGEETAAVLPTPLAAAPAAEVAPPPAAALKAQPAAESRTQPASAPPTETQLSAASLPATYAPPTPTLAALAAREPSAEARATGASLDGVAGAHLIASAAAERDTQAQAEARAPATAAVAEVEAQIPEEEPTRPSGARAAAPTYDELVTIGRTLSKKNRRVEASEAFRRALLQAPQGTAALSGLSFIYLNAEQNQQAREYAQRAVQADATNAEGWIVLGAALELLGDKTGSQDAYRNCAAQGSGPYLAQCRQVVRP